jgi:hypothetical protein
MTPSKESLMPDDTAPAAERPGFTIERWIDSLHEDPNAVVWTTKAELRAVLLASPAPVGFIDQPAPAPDRREGLREALDQWDRAQTARFAPYVKQDAADGMAQAIRIALAVASTPQAVDVERLGEAVYKAVGGKWANRMPPHELAAAIAAEYARLTEKQP